MTVIGIRRLLARALALSFIAVCWLLAATLALEFGARIIISKRFDANPHIARVRQGLQPLTDFAPAPVVTPEEAEAAFLDWRSQEASQGVAALLPPEWVWRVPSAPFADPQRSANRSRFGALSETHRNTYAIAHAELVVEFGEAAKPLSLYGVESYRQALARIYRGLSGTAIRALLLNEMQAAIKTAVRTARETGEVQGANVPAPLSNGEAPLLQIEAVPEPDSHGRVFLFINIHPDDLTAPMPADSEYITPYFRHKPNFLDPRGGFSTNSLGFRGEPVALTKPNGTTRIICIGGSTTRDGQTDDTTWPALLQTKLNTAGGGLVEVINAGMAGMTSERHLWRIGDYLAVSPDIAVIYTGINDTIIFMKLWLFTQRLTATLSAQNSAFCRHFCSSLLTPPKAYCAAFYAAATLQHLALIHAHLEAAGAEMVLVTVPYPDYTKLPVDERRYFDFRMQTLWNEPALTIEAYVQSIEIYNQMLRAFCKERNIYLIPFAEELPGGIDRFSDNCHSLIQEDKAIVAAAYLAPLVSEMKNQSSPPDPIAYLARPAGQR